MRLSGTLITKDSGSFRFYFNRGLLLMLEFTPSGCDTVSHSVMVPGKEAIRGWGQRFLEEFATSSTWRESFRVNRSRGKSHGECGSGHLTCEVKICGALANIDENLAKYIFLLTQAGAVTDSCCQGDEYAPAYIHLSQGAFPSELAAAWTAAGYDVDVQSVYASVGFPGWEHVAANAFLKSLDDWESGRLDLTGDSYNIKEFREFYLLGVDEMLRKAGLQPDKEDLFSPHAI